MHDATPVGSDQGGLSKTPDSFWTVLASHGSGKSERPAD